MDGEKKKQYEMYITLAVGVTGWGVSPGNVALPTVLSAPLHRRTVLL
jgi:hypothetical protein